MKHQYPVCFIQYSGNIQESRWNTSCSILIYTQRTYIHVRYYDKIRFSLKFAARNVKPSVTHDLAHDDVAYLHRTSSFIGFHFGPMAYWQATVRTRRKIQWTKKMADNRKRSLFLRCRSARWKINLISGQSLPLSKLISYQ